MTLTLFSRSQRSTFKKSTRSHISETMNVKLMKFKPHLYSMRFFFHALCQWPWPTFQGHRSTLQISLEAISQKVLKIDSWNLNHLFILWHLYLMQCVSDLDLLFKVTEVNFGKYTRSHISRSIQDRLAKFHPHIYSMTLFPHAVYQWPWLIFWSTLKNAYYSLPAMSLCMQRSISN